MCGIPSSLQIGAVLILMAMAFFNALYMYDLVTHHKVLEAVPHDNEGDHPTIGRHIVEEIKKEKEAKKLKIKVISSKEEAKIFVNDKEVHTYVCSTSAVRFVASCLLSLCLLSLLHFVSLAGSCPSGRPEAERDPCCCVEPSHCELHASFCTASETPCPPPLHECSVYRHQ